MEGMILSLFLVKVLYLGGSVVMREDSVWIVWKTEALWWGLDEGSLRLSQEEIEVECFLGYLREFYRFFRMQMGSGLFTSSSCIKLCLDHRLNSIV